MNENEQEESEVLKDEAFGAKQRLSGLGQKIIGEIETIGGVLTGDPNTMAEGEFNVEVGEIREELEDAETSDRRDDESND